MRTRSRARLAGLAVTALLPLCPPPGPAGPPGPPGPAPGGPVLAVRAPAVRAAAVRAAARPAPGRPAPGGAIGAADSPRLQSLLEELVAAGATGALTVVSDGTQTWYQSAGVAQLAPVQALNTAARFRAGSITKTFVAALALLLVDDGTLRLTDTVERWLPGVVPGGDAITLRMLLNQTSGLYDYTQDTQFATQLYTAPTVGRTPRALVDIATSYPPLFAPGQHWWYSDTNYIVAGMIIEAATHRGLPELLRERISTPLGLTGTSLPTQELGLPGYYAHGYRPPSLSGAGYQDVTALAPSLLWAAGALVSTAEDLRAFYGALVAGRLLSAPRLADLRALTKVNPLVGYGLGIAAVRGPCGTVWGHSGVVPGYAAYAFTDPTGRRTGVVAVPTEPDEDLTALLDLTVQTAVCQMFDRIPPASGAGYAGLRLG